MSNSPTQPDRALLALLPGLLGAIVLVATLPLIGSNDWYIWVQYAVAILALIVCVFAVQGKAYWWLIGLVPIAIVFNPVWPLPIADLWLSVMHLAAAVVFVAAGVTIRVPTGEKAADEKTAKRYGGRRR